MLNRSGNKANKTRLIVLSALITAILLAGKEALRALPNIEIVTVSILVFVCVFPFRSVIAAVFAFCSLQWVLYGFGYWVFYYYAYWPLLAVCALCLKKLKKPIFKTVFAALLAVWMTAIFAALSVFVDAAFLSGFSVEFWLMFRITWIRGVPFFITHIVSNAVITAVLFPLLCRVLRKSGAAFS